MSEFLKGRIKSLKYATKGMFSLLRTEHSIISQSCIALVFIAFFCHGIHHDLLTLPSYRTKRNKNRKTHILSEEEEL